MFSAPDPCYANRLWSVYFTTILMMRPGTTMVLTTCLPSRYFWLRSSLMAASMMASLLVVAGRLIWKRALPLKETGICTSSSTR